MQRIKEGKKLGGLEGQPAAAEWASRTPALQSEL